MLTVLVFGGAFVISIIVLIWIVVKDSSQPTVSYDQISAQIRKENDKLEEFIAEQSVVSDEDDEEEDDEEDYE